MERQCTLQGSYNAPEYKQCGHQIVWANLAEKQICREFGRYIRAWADFSNADKREKSPNLRKQNAEADLILPI